MREGNIDTFVSKEVKVFIINPLDDKTFIKTFYKLQRKLQVVKNAIYYVCRLIKSRGY